MSLRKNAFTLMEMMVVVVIVGVIAGLAFPKYARSVELSHRKDAENQLILIHSAQEMYASRNNSYYWGPATGGTPQAKLASINQNLGLNILENGKSYDCEAFSSAGHVTGYRCSAVRNGFTVTMTQAAINPGVNPSCTGSCP